MPAARLSARSGSSGAAGRPRSLHPCPADSVQVPYISGRVEVNLTVRDPARSADWYCELLGLERRYDYTSEDGQLRYVVVQDVTIGFVLGLVGHATNAGDPFSELRTGLDHLEFLVDRR